MGSEPSEEEQVARIGTEVDEEAIIKVTTIDEGNRSDTARGDLRLLEGGSFEGEFEEARARSTTKEELLRLLRRRHGSSRHGDEEEDDDDTGRRVP